MLGKLKDNMSFDSFMELLTTPFSSLSDLFLHNSLNKVLKKSSCVLHDEAIQKAVSFEKPSKKWPKKIQFS